MRFIQRWGNLLISKSTNLANLTVAVTSSTNQAAFFHSSPSLFEKWSKDETKSEKIRFVVREKRVDPKKVLKNILINGGSSATRPEMFARIESDYANQLNKRNRTKPSRQAKSTGHKKSKGKHRREDSFDAKFGKQGFTFAFGHPETDFEWTQSSGWSNKFEERNDRRCRVDCYRSSISDRKVLDLPTAGPLRIEDVKAAFRSSALKWHPDRHHSSSRAVAEEKFKHCVTAYKSLCEGLSDQ